MGWGGFERACSSWANATEQSLEALQTQLGLNRPLYVQYIDWVVGLLQGNMGESLRFGEPVAQNLIELSGRDCENYKNWRIAQGDVAEICRDSNVDVLLRKYKNGHDSTKEKNHRHRFFNEFGLEC